jgi:hypothetical protein
LIPGERGCDVSIEWSVPQEGSQRLLQHLFPMKRVLPCTFDYLATDAQNVISKMREKWEIEAHVKTQGDDSVVLTMSCPKSVPILRSRILMIPIVSLSQ